MLYRLFNEHPANVGESYLGHMGQAFYFGFSMLFAGLACLIHGFFPFLFVKTGSNAIRRLHERMVSHRDRRTVMAPAKLAR